jgi:hypothetical protein|tara:strand:- start:55 stop:312 length:258 start_codon:yes stop_codon:yes gene_type:complete
MLGNLDVVEIIKRILKYLIEGTAVALAAYYVPQGKQKLSVDSICIIAITAAATFAILDMYTPDISAAARMGAGFGIGGNLVNFPR